MLNGKATIYDIASDAGVSIATVSRVLRGETNVSAATREKVQRAIDRRNYRPSVIARGLTGKTTHSLGIILPKLLNPHYAMIFTGAQEEASARGFALSLFPRSSLDTDAYNPATMLAERRLDGVIVCVEYLPADHDHKVLAALEELKRFMPVVLIGCVPPWYDFPAICNNNAAMTKEIVSYLVSLGHERIALVGGIEGDTDPFRRDIGYMEGLREARLPFTDSYRVWGGGTPESGLAGLNGILNNLKPSFWPTAVIALNDLVAMGCYSAAVSHGLTLPRDLSVIGCDNMVAAPYLSPPLTTVDLHQRETGARAVKMLLGEESGRVDAPWDLIERGSCAACR